MINDEEFPMEQEIEDGSLHDFWSEQLQRAPWWLISIVFHSILALLATIAVIASKKPKVEDPYPVEIYQVQKQEEIVKPQITKEEVKDAPPVPTDEPVIEDPVVKEADISDHHETNNNDDNNQMSKGDADSHADSPFKAKFSNKAIGVGGNAGGYFGSRNLGGRKNLVKRGGGSPATETAVKAGLEWLKRHQSPDGRWDTDGYTSQCGQNPAFRGFCEGAGNKDSDPAMTGFALLCFLTEGSSTLDGQYQEQIKKGIGYLKTVQDQEGCIGPRSLPQHMYNHAIGTFALVEAYALSNFSPLLKIQAQKAVDFLLKAQNPGMGWRYTFAKGEDDTSVMGWCVMALRAAKEAGFVVPDSAFKGATNFLNHVTPAQEYRAAYRDREGELEFEERVIDDDVLFMIDLKNAADLDKGEVPRELAEKLKTQGKALGYNPRIEKTVVTNIDMALGSSRKEGSNDAWIIQDVISSNRQEFLLKKQENGIQVKQIKDKFAASESMTAVGMNARVFMQITSDDDVYVNSGELRLLNNLPVWGKDQEGYSLINYYYWYHGTLAMFQKDGPGWTRWNERIVDVLVNNQKKGGCEDGSWPAIGKRCRVNGRVYATAVSIMSLQIYYRYPRVFNNRISKK